ncbi:MAG: SUF system Fe-S cluster assembly regulator [Rhodospirillales bacterium]|nr:SUF system Fe-S cluster assembly regulator [Rhodospirillales bacterium]
MLRVSRLADYAVLLAGRMAREPARTFTAAALARDMHLPAPTVTKVLAALARAGLVDSQRGPGGGYRSAHAATDISVGAVIAAIDGPIALTICAEASDACDLMEICPSAANWQRINEAVRSTLEGISLEELTGGGAGFPLPDAPVAAVPGMAS